MSVALAPPKSEAPKTLTPEEFLLLPDEGRGYDLINGELKERNRSRESSRLGARCVIKLGNYAETTKSGWVFGEGMGFHCFDFEPGMIRHADTAFVSLKRMPVETYTDGGYSTVPHDVVVEAVSPNDAADDFEDKVQDWLDGGAVVVWLVYPQRQVVHERRQTGPQVIYRMGDTIRAEDALPGFELNMTDLFRKPGVLA